MTLNLYKFSRAFVVIAILSLAFTYQAGKSETIMAEVTAINSPVQVRTGSIIRVTVSVRNSGTEARSFYVGASFESWDRYETGNIWEDLPGWGMTPTLNPSSTINFTFGDYQILSDEYIGAHGIDVAIWTDSTRSTKITDRWFENVVTVVSDGAEIVDLFITVVEY